MSYSFGGCSTRFCSTEVIDAIGDQKAFCEIGDVSCVEPCVPVGWIEAHCVCDTGELFASFSFDFSGEAYCCGSKDCQDAIVSLFSAMQDTGDLKELLDSQCGIVECGGDDATSLQPSWSPSVTP